MLRSCSGLNRFGSHKLICLNVCPMENDTIRRYVLVRIGVALLEEIYYCGNGVIEFLCLSSAQSIYLQNTTEPKAQGTL